MKLEHDLLYRPDPDVLGKPRTERKWVKDEESQGANLNLDDHIGWGAECQVADLNLGSHIGWGTE